MPTEVSKNTEEKIINVAAELFAKNGFDGTSTREICRLANVNISLISYYFGGKKELYQKIVEHITNNIMSHMKSVFGAKQGPPNFDVMNKEQKIQLLFKMIEHMVDYFYSDMISDSFIMIIFREQMTSGVPVNSEGYSLFKRLLASILDKDENDKEVILRCLTIIGQVHSARIIKQFSLKMMNQDKYTPEDIQLYKNIISENIRSILTGLGVFNE